MLDSCDRPKAVDSASPRGEVVAGETWTFLLPARWLDFFNFDFALAAASAAAAASAHLPLRGLGGCLSLGLEVGRLTGK